MLSFVSLLSGFVFGIGLHISGMTNPKKVIGFLDFFGGSWDPSLAFVMVGGIGLFMLVFQVGTRVFKKPFLVGDVFQGLGRPKIEKATIIGPIIFGLGWGLYGVCPGPALCSLTQFSTTVFVFLGGLVLGFLINSFKEKLAS